MKHFRLTVDQDEDNENPRKCYDHMGTMVCWHRRYTLGDEQPDVSHEEYLEGLLDRCVRASYPEGLKRANASRLLDSRYARLPLYLHDHSGITMNTAGFSCPWDSGQVGFIYCDLKAAMKRFGLDKGDWTARVKYNGEEVSLRKAAELELQTEVETYDKYLTGEIYQYTVESCELEDGQNPDEGVWDVVSSCGGYYHESEAEQDGQEELERCKKALT